MSGLTEVQITAGKTLRVDPYPVDTATLRFVGVSSWTIDPRIGNRVQIEQTENNDATFVGYIKDVQYEYGILSAEDTCTITVEGVMSLLGRRTLNAYTTTNTRTISQAGEICDEVGIGWFSVDSSNGRSVVTTQTYSGNAFDLVNELILTESGFMNEYGSSGLDPEVVFVARNLLPYPFGFVLDSSEPVVFSDTAASTSKALYYDAIQFRSAAENYYTQIVVEPQGLTRQVASSGAKPYRGLTIQTLDSTTAQADDLAEYLLNMYSKTNIYATSISLTYERQDTTTKQNVFKDMLLSGNFAAVRGQIVFRGSTYNVMIEGAEISTSVEGTTQMTFYFTSEAMNNFLLLNDSVYGTLDTNRLGF